MKKTSPELPIAYGPEMIITSNYNTWSMDLKAVYHYGCFFCGKQMPQKGFIYKAVSRTGYCNEICLKRMLGICTVEGCHRDGNYVIVAEMACFNDGNVLRHLFCEYHASEISHWGSEIEKAFTTLEKVTIEFRRQ